MAKQVIALEATLNSGPAEGSVKSLKAQLREAQAEVGKMSDKFGETSVQAAQAAQKAAQLKDRIGDAKALTDAFNPDAKFNAFASALQGVVGGFTAVQGAMGLMGAKSEDVEQMLLKVNSAMALSQGLNAITAAKDSFKNLGVVAGNVFNSIKTAIGSTGIGALAIALGALVTYWDDITSAINKVDEKQKALNETFEAYKSAAADASKKTTDVKVAFDLARKGVITKDEALKKYNETLGDAFGTTTDLNVAEKLFRDKTEAYIKAAGLRAQADALMKKAAEEKVKQIEAEKKGKDDISEIDKDVFAKLPVFGELYDKVQSKISKKTKESINNSKDNANAYTDAAESIMKQAIELEKSNSIKNDEEIKSDKEAAKEKAKTDEELKQKRLKNAEELRQQRLKDAEDLRNANAKAASDTRKLEEENYLLSLKDERKRQEAALQIQFENQSIEIEKTVASKKEKDAQQLELEKNYLLKLANLRQGFADEDAKKKEEEDKKLLENEKEMDAIMLQLEKDSIEEQKKASEEKIKIAETEAKAKIQFLTDIGNAMGVLSDVIGKETAVGKGLAVAQATINTWLGATEVLRAKSVLPEPLGTASKIINVAAIVATGIKSVKSILATKVTGGGGASSGGGSAPSLPSTSTASPIQPQLSNTILNQQAINQVGNAAIRSYVVESDVAGNQERIERLNRAARIS